MEVRRCSVCGKAGSDNYNTAYADFNQVAYSVVRKAWLCGACLIYKKEKR